MTDHGRLVTSHKGMLFCRVVIVKTGLHHWKADYTMFDLIWPLTASRTLSATDIWGLVDSFVKSLAYSGAYTRLDAVVY